MSKKLFTPFFIIISFIVLLFFFIIISYRPYIFTPDQATAIPEIRFQEKRYINPIPPPSGDLLVTPGAGQINKYDTPVINVNDEILGSPNAQNTIFIFANLSIKYVTEIESIIDQIYQDYSDSVVIIWKDYIDEELYPDSKSLSTSAHCAGEQNKFWEYKNLVMTKGLNSLEIIDELNLNQEEFNNCVSNNGYQVYYDEIKEEATTLDIPGMPIMYVNDNVIYPDITYENIVQFLY